MHLNMLQSLQTLLDDQCVKAASMRASPLIGPLAGAASAWAATLDALQDLLDAWLACQVRLCNARMCVHTIAYSCTLRQTAADDRTVMEPA